MDTKILIEWAEKDIANLERIASSDNPDPCPSDISMAREEIEAMQKFIDRKDYEALEELMRMDAEKLGYIDAKEGLYCDASQKRERAIYFGLFVNDYYNGYKLAKAEMRLEARNEDYQSTILEDSTNESSEDSHYESAWA